MQILSSPVFSNTGRVIHVEGDAAQKHKKKERDTKCRKQRREGMKGWPSRTHVDDG
jgi:hypothetical protein